MSLEQAILEAVRALPAEKQQEVLNHAARLRDEAGLRKGPLSKESQRITVSASGYFASPPEGSGAVRCGYGVTLSPGKTSDVWCQVADDDTGRVWYLFAVFSLSANAAVDSRFGTAAGEHVILCPIYRYPRTVLSASSFLAA